MRTAKILAIDTSCDDSSSAVVEGVRVLSNIVASQNQIHKKYGGVFPTLAKQAHKENLDPAIQTAMAQARVTWSEIDAIAVTIGPGLAPALEVGIAKAKELSLAHDKKIIAVNHVEAHALSPLACRGERNLSKGEDSVANTHAKQPQFPSLAIVISGGHSEFILVEQIGQYHKLGQTIDDAAGECLDKVGRILNLGYPAGPLVETFAKKGRADQFSFPRAMTGQANFDLSFSGVKTFARNLIAQLETEKKLTRQTIYDLSRGLQDAVFAQIIYKLERILLSSDLQNGVYPSRDFLRHLADGQAPLTPIKEIWLGGGVAANISLRQAIRRLLHKYYLQSGKKIKLQLRVPYSKKLCGDNAAMIGVVAGYKLARGEFAKVGEIEREPSLGI